MTRFDRIDNMDITTFAMWLLKTNPTLDTFCQSDCESGDCPHPVDCCVTWLKGKVIEDDL